MKGSEPDLETNPLRLSLPTPHCLQAGFFLLLLGEDGVIEAPAAFAGASANVRTGCSSNQFGRGSFEGSLVEVL